MRAGPVPRFLYATYRSGALGPAHWCVHPCRMRHLNDRSYLYLGKTFDAPNLDCRQFTTVMQSEVLPIWRTLHSRGLIASAHVLQKTGDIDLFTLKEPIRDWRYFALLEIAEGVGAVAVAEAERDLGLRGERLERHSIQYLSNEALQRPAGAGTALPIPSQYWDAPPANHSAGIEYIQIPDDYWDEYRRFMRDVMGPVGARLVALGHSYQIQIMERTHVLHRDASLPDWNRIHILWGDFDDSTNGFIERARRAAHDVLRLDVHGALSSTNHYRLKPRMSKNQLLKPLCIEHAQRRAKI